MKITHLRINGMKEPLGIAASPLLLSWLVEDAAGEKPVFTRVRLSDRPDMASVLWQTEGPDLPWEGLPLEVNAAPRTRYYVTAEVTDNAGGHALGRTWFETGKLDEPWTGQWVGPEAGLDCSPVLRGSFPGGEVRAARLYITGLGLYKAALNGQPVTDEALTPGLSDYESHVQYQTYDVTPLVQEENTLEVTLGNGWYKGRYGLERTEVFGERYALLAEVRVELADGSQRAYAADGSWTWTHGPIRDDGIYDGETLDRLTQPGTPRPVQSVDVGLEVVERYSLPVREMEVLPVREVIRTPAGETVLDFGQNHTGWIRFRSRLPRGARVRFEFGEVLQRGNFYNENYRGANGGFAYISDGREETVQPSFTYFGFRYVRVTGWAGELDANDFESPVLYSALETTGQLSTGRAEVNRLIQNALWSQKSNFLDIPTDCPQRDERLGWTGDAQVFAPTACYFMDCRAFYRKFLRFLRSEQLRHGGAAPTYVPSMGDFKACAIWSDAAVLIPDTLLRMTGSAAEVADYYPMMQDWVDWVAARCPRHLFDTGFQLGDWLAQDGVTDQSFKGGTDDVYLATAYYYQSAALTARLAGLLGKEEDRKRYESLAASIREAFLDAYVTPAGRLSVDTQAAYVAALKLGLYRDKAVVLEQFRRRLRFDGYRIKCGFAGAPLLCQTLAQEGLDTLACDFLLNRGFPGWLYCVELGATTIWERWNSLLPDGSISGTGMNSLNHYSYGSVAEYMFAYLAGVRPDGLGFRHAVIDPRPDVRLGHVDCACRTASGLYRCCWRIEEDGHFSMELEVPFGCTATVTLPRSAQPPFQAGPGRHEYRYLPQRDFRAVYGMDTRLSQLAGDAEAEKVLGETLPQLLGVLQSGDVELGSQSFDELSGAFFLGLNPDNVSALVEKLQKILHKPGA